MDEGDSITDEMVPVRDPKDYDHANGGILSTFSEADQLFNQERALVSRLSRDALEDRYLRIMEESVVLKKHACKQEDKIKKLATKLIRVLSEKRRLEMSVGVSQISRLSRLPSDGKGEVLEDQQYRIRDLERQVTVLREKLNVAKQQLIGPTGRNVKYSSKGHHRQQKQHQNRIPSPGASAGPHSPAPLLSQQAQRLLEEARNENRLLEDSINTLKEQINIFEQELAQIKEQHKIKESNSEEEIQLLKAQLLDGQRHTAEENIQLIQLHKDTNMKDARLKTLTAQLKGSEEALAKATSDSETAKAELDIIAKSLSAEQKKLIELSKELADVNLNKQILEETQEKIRDMERENSILRDANRNLLDSAYSVERERQYHASEHALKVQIAQLEATIKRDLEEKKILQDHLNAERTKFASIECEFAELKSKHFSVQAKLETHEEKMKFFASENDMSEKDMQDALLILRQKRDLKKPTDPSFLDVQETSTSDLKGQFAELQVQYVAVISELEKTRSLLRVQSNISDERKQKIDEINLRLKQLKGEYQGQMEEYKKFLEKKDNKIRNLEDQLREAALGSFQKSYNKGNTELPAANALHMHSGQVLFEIHVQTVSLTQEAIIHLGLVEPKLFLAWVFYAQDMQYTPIVQGPEANFDASALYKIKMDGSFLDYLYDGETKLELFMALGDDCKKIGSAMIKTAEVLDYPGNRLHGCVTVNGVQSKPIGKLSYWFKLHASAEDNIRSWISHKNNTGNVPLNNEKCTLPQKGQLPKAEEIKVPSTGLRAELQQAKLELEKELEEMNRAKREAQSVKAEAMKLKSETESEMEDIRANRVVVANQRSIQKPAVNKEIEDVRGNNKVKISKEEKVVRSGNLESKTENEGENPKKESKKEQSTHKDVNKESEPVVATTVRERPKPKSRMSREQKMDKGDESQDDVKKKDDVQTTAQENQSDKQPAKKGILQRLSSRFGSKASSNNSKTAKTNLTKSVSQEDDKRSEEPSDTESESQSGENSSSDDDEEDSEEDEDVVVSSKATHVSHNTDSLGNESLSQEDSEGLVIKQQRSQAAANVSSESVIIIDIVEFHPSESAQFLLDESVGRLYVEYSFLDLDIAETETPISLPKPTEVARPVVFNFRKVVPVTNDRRQVLSDMIKSKNGNITFSVISEPPPQSESTDCFEIGYAEIDLLSILTSRENIIKQAIEVRDRNVDTVTVVGNLIVTVLAKEALEKLQ